MLNNINTLNDSPQKLEFFAIKSCLNINDNNPISIEICLRRIKTARFCIKHEITRQINANEQYQHDLATNIIDRQYRHLSHEHSLSEKLEQEDLINNKLRYMLESRARRNLCTMLKFDIKGFIDPYSIARNALARVDATEDGRITPLTAKVEIEDHFLTRNPHAHWASGTTRFGHTALGRAIGPTGDSPLANSILGGFFSHPNLAVSAFTQQLRRRNHCPDIPAARVTEKQLSRAFSGLREKSATSPYGLYNAQCMCIAAKKSDLTSNPIRKIQVNLVVLPLAHGFAPDRHLV
jgi:hypothetical protein